MTNTKTTKRSLFSSVVALLLCFTMLLGTTYAWFTDSASSGVNTIKAGNLDIELYHTNAKVSGKVDSETKLFNDIALWEPNAVVYETFEIANKGNLALQYLFSVNVANATDNGKGRTLADVLKVGVIENGAKATDRDGLVEEVKKWESLATFSLSGQLLEGESNTFTVVIYWKPGDSDNEYNMNTGDKKPLEVDIGVTLMATQYTYESDGFNDQYDADAVLYNTIVTSEAELKTALQNAKSGDVIGISGNVYWTTGAITGSTPFTDKAISITLHGVDEDASFIAIGNGVGPVGIDNGTVVFKNLKIVDESVSYTEGSWEYGYLEFRGNTVFENCDIVSAIMMEGNSATFKNCSFNSNKDSEYAVWVANGDATFENCYFTGPRGIKVHEAYKTEVGTVIINNNTFAALTEKPGLAIGNVNANTTIKLTNNLFAGTQAGDQGNYKYESDTDVVIFNFVDEDNTVQEEVNVIGTAADLLALSNKQLKGTYALTADIDLGGASFSAMDTTRDGTLTFIGNGHTISNVNIVSGDGDNDNTTGQASMFYVFPYSTLTVSDLTLKDITVTADENASGYAAAVIGYCEGNAVLNNVDVVEAAVNGVKSSGMLVGHLSGTLEATGCDVSGTVTLSDYEADGHYAGKYIGTLAGTAKLAACTARVTVSGNLHANNYGDDFGRAVNGGKLNNKTVTVTFVSTVDELNGVLVNHGDDTNTIIVLKAGEYDVIKAKSNVTLYGTKGANVYAINLNGAENVTIKNLTFDAATAVCGYNGKGTATQYANIITGDSSKQAKGARNLVIDGCTFEGTFANGGVAIAFTDQSRSSGQSGNITIKGCTFKTTGGYYDIYTFYSGYGTLNIEGNTFASELDVEGCPIYLGRYQSSTPVVVKGNVFEAYKSFDEAASIQEHSAAYTVSFAAADNTFRG